WSEHLRSCPGSWWHSAQPRPANADRQPIGRSLVIPQGALPFSKFGEEIAEIIRGREILVDRSKADEGYVVEPFEAVHDVVADLVRCDFHIAQAFELADDA